MSKITLLELCATPCNSTQSIHFQQTGKLQQTQKMDKYRDKVIFQSSFARVFFCKKENENIGTLHNLHTHIDFHSIQTLSVFSRVRTIPSEIVDLAQPCHVKKTSWTLVTSINNNFEGVVHCVAVVASSRFKTRAERFIVFANKSARYKNVHALPLENLFRIPSNYTNH